MRYDDQRRVGGLTWIGWLNLAVLQWLCLRLASYTDDAGVMVGWTVRPMPPVVRWRSPYDVASATMLFVAAAIFLRAC